MATLNIKLSGIKAHGVNVDEVSINVEYSSQELIAIINTYPALIEALINISSK